MQMRQTRVNLISLVLVESIFVPVFCLICLLDGGERKRLQGRPSLRRRPPFGFIYSQQQKEPD